MTASASAPAQRSGVIAPYGGTLVDLMVAEADRAAVKATATKTIECSDRNACDVELLCVGGFSPLRGFMHQEDYDAVVSGHRLAAGQLFGLPIVMDTDRDDVVVGDKLLLTYKGQDLAVLEVEDKWEPNKVAEAKGCYGTTSIEHPAVRMITMERKRFYMGGSLQGLALPERVFPCKTPAEVRAGLPEGEDVVAFQCRNPIHRAHYELFTRALHAQNVSDNAVVLVHPTCGPTQQDDIPGAVRFQTYERLAAEVNNDSIRWAYLPYAMHMAGPREALQHMIIRRNYGCTHFIIGSDVHAVFGQQTEQLTIRGQVDLGTTAVVFNHLSGALIGRNQHTADLVVLYRLNELAVADGVHLGLAATAATKERWCNHNDRQNQKGSETDISPTLVHRSPRR